MSALQKKRVLVEQEVHVPTQSSPSNITGLSFVRQVLKELQHPHIVAYVAHFFDDDALHVRPAPALLCSCCGGIC